MSDIKVHSASGCNKSGLLKASSQVQQGAAVSTGYKLILRQRMSDHFWKHSQKQPLIDPLRPDGTDAIRGSA